MVQNLFKLFFKSRNLIIFCQCATKKASLLISRKIPLYCIETKIRKGNIGYFLKKKSRNKLQTFCRIWDWSREQRWRECRPPPVWRRCRTSDLGALLLCPSGRTSWSACARESWWLSLCHAEIHMCSNIYWFHIHYKLVKC